jgi:hypothetical protein
LGFDARLPWVNANDLWMEGDRSLVTGYALTALSYCSVIEAVAFLSRAFLRGAPGEKH